MVFITIVTGANLNQLISWEPHIVGIPLGIASISRDHPICKPPISQRIAVLFFWRHRSFQRSETVKIRGLARFFSGLNGWGGTLWLCKNIARTPMAHRNRWFMRIYEKWWCSSSQFALVITRGYPFLNIICSICFILYSYDLHLRLEETPPDPWSGHSRTERRRPGRPVKSPWAINAPQRWLRCRHIRRPQTAVPTLTASWKISWIWSWVISHVPIFHITQPLGINGL